MSQLTQTLGLIHTEIIEDLNENLKLVLDNVYNSIDLYNLGETFNNIKNQFETILNQNKELDEETVKYVLETINLKHFNKSSALNISLEKEMHNRNLQVR
jgi:hypothetical protein